MNRTIPLLAFAGLVALSGCAGLGFGDRYGDYRGGGYYENDRYNDGYGYGYDSGYYRAVQRDVREYADALDRYLGISNRQEKAVREILEYRAYELLEATRVRDHARVYPFPRRPGRAERFWALADRDIARVLDRRYHEPYAYYNRYGGDRYREYYRHRRYDDRRGWYDTRRTPRRDERRAAEDRRDRREDVREARRDQQRREEARRRDDRRDRGRAGREERRAQERRADEARDRRRTQAARQRADRERAQREDRARQPSRREDARRTDRRRAEKDEGQKKEEAADRRRSRRGGNN